jgi:hypothetical protein
MSDHDEIVRQWLKDRMRPYISTTYTEQKYIFVYVFVIFVGLLISPLLPPSISTGLLAATAIFAIHETVKMRFAILVDTLSSLHSNSFLQIERKSYAFIGGAVPLDLIVAVPMFSPQAYAWNYTIMVISYIGIFAFYVQFGRFLLNEILAAIDKIRSRTNNLSNDFNQWSHSLGEHPAIPSKYSNRLERITRWITPMGLVVCDIFLLIICLIYLALYHPHLIQFNPNIWMDVILHPTNPSVWLLLSLLVVLFNALVIDIMILLAVIAVTIVLLPLLVSISLLIAPGLVWQGIEKAPDSILLWSAISVLILFVVYFLPPTLRYFSSAEQKQTYR